MEGNTNLVLFLDEPTSGLDATNTRELVSCLHKIAQSGVTVIAVLHQPRYEVFEMFDDILLLSSGKIVYSGDFLVPFRIQLHCQSFH